MNYIFIVANTNIYISLIDIEYNTFNLKKRLFLSLMKASAAAISKSHLYIGIRLFIIFFVVFFNFSHYFVIR